MTLTIYGPHYSSYVRSVTLALQEKGAAYELSEVDIFKGEQQQPDHLARSPFGKVPAIDHDGFVVYETTAILRYLDKALGGASMVPADPKAAARMDQMIGVIDAHAYPQIVSVLAIQRVVAPMMGGTPDEAAIAAAIPKVELALKALEDLSDHSQEFLTGSSPSLADVFVAPVIGFMMATPEGSGLLQAHPRLSAWWASFSARPSMAATAPKLG